MSDPVIPDKLIAAGRWALAGIVLFVFFLLAAEKLADQQYVSGTVFSILFLSTFALAVKWNTLFNWITPVPVGNSNSNILMV
jgi:hypothetical protein